MLRSVSRYAVELSRPESMYFERIIAFVRPEFAREGMVDLHSEAEKCAAAIDRESRCELLYAPFEELTVNEQASGGSKGGFSQIIKDRACLLTVLLSLVTGILLGMAIFAAFSG